MLTTNSELTYTYIFPMLVVMMLFSNVRFLVGVCVAATLVNVADIVYRDVKAGYEDGQTTDLEIRTASVLLVSMFLIVSTVCLRKINEYRLAQVKKEKKRKRRTRP